VEPNRWLKEGVARAALARFECLDAGCLQRTHGSRDTGVYDMVVREIGNGAYHVEADRNRLSRATWSPFIRQAEAEGR
jgi:hypothetical protein